jgi:hypothetical protein
MSPPVAIISKVYKWRAGSQALDERLLIYFILHDG